MRVNEAHLVEEAAGDTDEHVVDVRADGADAGKLLAPGEPNVDADLLAVPYLGKVHVDVLETSGEGAARSGDGNDTRLDVDSD
jgi:hypothetical protein